MSPNKGRIGIIGAMPEEIQKLKENVKNAETEIVGIFEFTKGELSGRNVVFGMSNVGKTFASSVATIMIERFKVVGILFSGVAGGLTKDIEIGELVIADQVLDYDMNCKNFILPFKPEYRHKLGEIPFINLREYKTDEELMELAIKGAKSMSLKFRKGTVVSGSEFLSLERKVELAHCWKECENPVAVEMEGSAVGQICHVFKIPFLLIRAISDNMQGDANEDFNKFTQIAADNCFHIVEYVVNNVKSF